STCVHSHLDTSSQLSDLSHPQRHPPAARDARRVEAHFIIGNLAAPINPASLPNIARVTMVLRFGGTPRLFCGSVARYTNERFRSSAKSVGENISHALETPPPITYI